LRRKSIHRWQGVNGGSTRRWRGVVLYVKLYVAAVLKVRRLLPHEISQACLAQKSQFGFDFTALHRLQRPLLLVIRQIHSSEGCSSFIGSASTAQKFQIWSGFTTERSGIAARWEKLHASGSSDSRACPSVVQLVRHLMLKVSRGRERNERG
jgi:hypothetical protein